MRIADRASWRKSVPLQAIPKIDWARQRPTHLDAKPAVIQAALSRSQRRPSGNWYVVAASSDIRSDRPFGAEVGGTELVAWRDAAQKLHVGPGACPHLGADLATGTLDCGTLICPWHGLRLSGDRSYGWKPFPCHDDGVLVWVRLDTLGGEAPLDLPVVPARPENTELHAVTQLTGTCEPRDIIANRLDPWHGAWFHPYSFTRLDVLSSPTLGDDVAEQDDRFLVAVTFRLGRFGVPVIAEFTCPGPRTIVMRIVDGEGVGSVVETHATPLRPDANGARTVVTEAVIAHSDRDGFAHARRVSRAIAPFMRYAATRLWRDDLVYAERLYSLRSQR